MLAEALLLYGLMIGAIKGLYLFRSHPFVGQFLTVLVAATLIYLPLMYAKFRKIKVDYFENDFENVRRPLQYFLITSLILFPLFFGASHLYQKILFEKSPHFFLWKFSITSAVVQLMLVALPEEFFFRGFLQTLLTNRFPQKIKFFGGDLFSIGWATIFTSVLFALAHSLIAVQWWHFAIFFPSLVFGWLRERTGGLVAPILFHALSNQVIYLIGSIYA